MSVAGVAASIAAFVVVVASYLHQVTYKLGLRHGEEQRALEARHAREEATEARSRETHWRDQSARWRDIAMTWMGIANRAAGRSAGAATGADSVAARASATMIGLRAASGESVLDDVEALARMCADHDELASEEPDDLD
jgi:hypothetical protein